MDSEEYRRIEGRIDRLEREVAGLRAILSGITPEPVATQPAPKPFTAPELVFRKAPVAQAEAPPWRTAEYWLGRIGIGLTLLAGCLGIFMLRGWRSLFWVAAAGGWNWRPLLPVPL